MPSLKKVAISIGDLNGVGFEIALKAHTVIRKLCHPVYCVEESMAKEACAMLNLPLPEDFILHAVAGTFEICPGVVDEHSGRYSFDSFMAAIELAKAGAVDAIVTLPIHKEAWNLAGIGYVGHTDALRDIFSQDAIMMLGCEKLYVALYTEHIPLREVASQIRSEKLLSFFRQFYESIMPESVAVLGLNPHAGDHGVLGDEEREIESAIAQANREIGQEVFFGPVVPDIAFTPRFRENLRHIVAMYHDQGLGPLKALYFDEGINVSLGLPIIRTSVDHGTAFDIAYQGKASILSYLNAIKAAVEFAAQERRFR